MCHPINMWPIDIEWSLNEYIICHYQHQLMQNHKLLQEHSHKNECAALLLFFLTRIHQIWPVAMNACNNFMGTTSELFHLYMRQHLISWLISSQYHMSGFSFAKLRGACLFYLTFWYCSCPLPKQCYSYQVFFHEAWTKSYSPPVQSLLCHSAE